MLRLQDEIEHQSATLIVQSAQFLGRVLKSAINKYMTFCKEINQQKAGEGPVVLFRTIYIVFIPNDSNNILNESIRG